MATYTKPRAELVELMGEVLEKYHGELSALEVRVDLLVAHGKKNGEGAVVTPAIRVHGCQAVGCIRITGLKERVAGRGDAEMVLDGDQLDGMGEATVAAVIDHELTHLEAVTDAEGGPVLDDNYRPKLKVRRHDRQFGWFDAVARRHGDASYEVMQAKELIVATPENVQLYLPGFEVGELKPKRKKVA